MFLFDQGEYFAIYEGIVFQFDSKRARNSFVRNGASLISAKEAKSGNYRTIKLSVRSA